MWNTQRIILPFTRACWENPALWSPASQQFIHCGCGQYSQPVSLRVNLTNCGANNNQDSTTTGGHTESTQETLLKHLVQMIKKIVPLYHIVHLPRKTTLPRSVYLIHRNNHRDTAKMGRLRNISQIKEEKETPETELTKMEEASYQIQSSKH